MTNKYYFPDCRIWRDIYSKKVKQQDDWWIFNSEVELPAPHTQNGFAQEIEPRTKIKQITRLFITGASAQHYASVTIPTK